MSLFLNLYLPFHFVLSKCNGLPILTNRYFAFFNYTQSTVGNQTVVTSHCDQTFVGTYHDSSIGAAKWGCFKGFRIGGASQNVEVIDHSELARKTKEEHETLWTNNARYIAALNKAQSTWKAAAQPIFEGKTAAELKRLAGNPRRTGKRLANLRAQSKLMKSKRNIPEDEKNVSVYNGKTGQFETYNAKKLRASLPTEFSWTNVGGRDFVVPVRNQEKCGSCYAFSTSHKILLIVLLTLKVVMEVSHSLSESTLKIMV